jgi:hypothetical protein
MIDNFATMKVEAKQGGLMSSLCSENVNIKY